MVSALTGLNAISLEDFISSEEEEELTPEKREEALKAEAEITMQVHHQKPTFKRKRKSSFRKSLPKIDLAQIDHAICGPPCKRNPVPDSVLELNKRYEQLFPESLPKGLPPSRDTDHRIDLKPDSKPPAKRLYRCAPGEETVLKETLNELLDKGFIEPSNSPYGAGCFFVPKPHSTKLRMVVDFSQLNAQTIVDQYPLPRIDELIDQIGSAKVFSTLDLHSGFHQIRVHPDHVSRTAFKTKFGTFQYLVMPFGLCNAPATFQRTMDKLINDFRTFAGMYIDDLLIFSATLDDHVKHLEHISEILLKEKFYCNSENAILHKRKWNTVASLWEPTVFDLSRKS